MRVALLLPFDAAANRGNSVAALRLARGLEGAGVTVLVTSLEAAGVPFGPEGSAPSVARIGPALRAFRPDLVHALHGYRSGPAGVALASALGCALVVGLRGTDVTQDLHDPSRRDVMLDALGAADAVVAFARFMLEPALAARPALASRSFVVPHGVAGRFFTTPASRNGPPGVVQFLLPVNLRAVKAPHVAVLGLDEVVGSRPGVRLVVAGPTLEAEVGRRLADLAASRPWLGRLGEVPHEEMPSRMAQADIVVNTSVAEGMSNAVLEAMAMGRALLLSDIPAHREIVDPGVEALLFDPGGADGGVAAFAREAARLADDPSLRASLGAAAAARARARHTAAEETARTLAVYREALGRRA